MARLRWLAFGHVEADECGAVNQILAAAPQAEVAHGGSGAWCRSTTWPTGPRCRWPTARSSLGQHRVRHIDTPHVPHAWEARVLFEESTGTLLCGDLCSRLGDGPAVTTDDVAAAAHAEDVFGASCLTPHTGPTIRRLAELAPSTLAVMHGSCYRGDGAAALRARADDYDVRLSAARP